MGLIETEAIILRNHKLGEADKIVVALTRHEGVVRGVARGARRLQSKFGASLEPFTLIRLTFFEKESRELVSFTQAEIIESYFEITRHDEVFLKLESLAGLILEFAPLRAPDERFFRMMSACLESIAQEPQNISHLTRYGEIWALKIAGFLPELSRCGMCQQAFTMSNTGGMLDSGNTIKCRRCSDGRGVAISNGTLRRLSSALKKRPGDWAQTCQIQTGINESELSDVLHLLLSRALEREPRFRPTSSSS